MKQISALYAAWIVGVISAAGIAYWYWVKYLGESVDGNEE